VKIKYADFRIVTRSRTASRPVAARELLHEISLALVRAIYPVTIGIRLVGVSVSNFSSNDDAQLDLQLLQPH
jgi:DNA polymerase-4